MSFSGATVSALAPMDCDPQAVCADWQHGESAAVLALPATPVNSSRSVSHEDYASDASGEESSAVPAKTKSKLRRKTGTKFSRRCSYSSSEEVVVSRMKQGDEDDSSCGSRIPYTPIESSFHTVVNRRRSARRVGYPKYKDAKRFAATLLSVRHGNGRPVASASASTSASSIRITSFREYYFRPILKREEEEQHVCIASPPKTGFQFLRKSRYLEKMVKDYGLRDIVFSPSSKTIDENSEELYSTVVDHEETIQNVDGTPLRDSSTSSLLSETRSNMKSGERLFSKGRHVKIKRRFPQEPRRFPKTRQRKWGFNTDYLLRQIVGQSTESKITKRASRSWFGQICGQVDGSEATYGSVSPSVRQRTIGRPQACIHPSRMLRNVDKEVLNHDRSTVPVLVDSALAIASFTEGGSNQMASTGDISGSGVTEGDGAVCPRSSDSEIDASLIYGSKKSKPRSGPLATLKRKVLAIFTQLAPRYTHLGLTKERNAKSCSTITDMASTSELARPSMDVVNECLTGASRLDTCRGTHVPHKDRNRSALNDTSSSSTSTTEIFSTRSSPEDFGAVNSETATARLNAALATCASRFSVRDMKASPSHCQFQQNLQTPENPVPEVMIKPPKPKRKSGGRKSGFLSQKLPALGNHMTGVLQRVRLPRFSKCVRKRGTDSQSNRESKPRFKTLKRFSTKFQPEFALKTLDREETIKKEQLFRGRQSVPMIWLVNPN